VAKQVEVQPTPVTGRRKTTIVLVIAVILLGAMGGGGYWYYQMWHQPITPAPASTSASGQTPKPAIHTNQNLDAPNAAEMGLERLAAARTRDYWVAWSSPNTVALTTIEGFYGNTIKFYGKVRSRSDVMKEKRKFAERWPDRKYEARDGSISIKCDPATAACNVTGIVDWQAASPPRSARATGVAHFLFTFVLQGDRAKIASESGSVVR
jgi:hypothetical protein